MTEHEVEKAVELMILLEQMDREYQNDFLPFCFFELVKLCVIEKDIFADPMVLAKELKLTNAEYLSDHFKQYNPQGTMELVRYL